MWPRFGIKIGNSTLSIACLKEASGKPEVIANKQGDRTSQACLLWDGVHDEIECGLTAKQKMATRPKQAIAHSLQFLLTPSAGVGEEESTASKLPDTAARKEIPCDYDELSHSFQLKCNIQPQKEKEDGKEITKAVTPYEAHVHLFRAELELARQHHTNADHKPIGVLSVPSYYSRKMWSQLAKAAAEAGFHVAQIVEEPNAAILAYSIAELQEKTETPSKRQYVMTIKCGGLFSHFAFYAVEAGFYTHLCSFGPYEIGGSQFTQAVVDYICDEFQKKWKLDPRESRRSLAKIKVAAANAKHILTSMPTTQLYIDSLMDGIDFNTQMSRARFEGLIQPVTSKFMQTLSTAVEEAMKQHEEIKAIDAIVLLGATMQIPKLQAVVAQRFPEAQIHNSIAADEVVAIGCARQTAFLIDPEAQVLDADSEEYCIEQDLKIWHGEDSENAKILLRKGSIIPAKVHVTLKPGGISANMDLFKINMGDEVHEIILKDANTGKDGSYRIEADIGVDSEDDTPQIVLRCL